MPHHTESSGSDGRPLERSIHSPTVSIFISSVEGGGAERIMCNLANAFVDRGVRTDLVLTRRTGPYLDLVDTRVRIVSLDTRRPVFALPRLVRYLREFRPEALLSALNHTNLIAVAARHLSRVSVRHIVSQRIDASIRPSLIREPLEILNYGLIGLAYRHADAIVAVSEGVARSLERVHRIPGSMIRVIYNSVEAPPIVKPESNKHRWLKPGGPPLILGAGRLTQQKGFDTLLRAVALIASNRPVRLAILGMGKDEPHLSELASDLDLDGSVVMPGFMPNPGEWMRRADVFVLSSRYEGLPGVLLQAMACGTPVVSTDCPSGPYEILEGGRWGKLVPVDDDTALATAICQTLDDPTPPDVATRAGQFDLTSMVNAYLEVLQVEDLEVPSEVRTGETDVSGRELSKKATKGRSQRETRR